MASNKKNDFPPRSDKDTAEFPLPDAKRLKKAGLEDAAEVYDLREYKPAPSAEAFAAKLFTDDDQYFNAQVCDDNFKVLQIFCEARLVLQELQMATEKIATCVFGENDSKERSLLLLHKGKELLDEANSVLQACKDVVEDPVALLKGYIDKVGKIAAHVASHLDKEKGASSEKRLPEGLETLHLHLTSFGKEDTISYATNAAAQEFKEAMRKDKQGIQTGDGEKLASFVVEQLLQSNMLALESLIGSFEQIDAMRVARFAAAKAPPVSGDAPLSVASAPAYTEQQFFYITNRRFDSETGTYSNDIQEQKEYGKGSIRIPTPGMANDNYEVTPKMDSRIQADGKEYQAFVTELSRELEKSEVKELFFFIHGYKVDFMEALRTTGKLGYGSKFRGIMVGLDWASMGAMANYQVKGDNDDKARVEKSAAPFGKVLTNLLNDLSGVAKAHILAHSMGNFLFCKMVESLVPGSTGSVASPLRKFANVIFAAADASRREFTDMLDRLERINGFSAVRTVYCNDQDASLLLSGLGITQLGPRVGFCTRGLGSLRDDHVVHPYYYTRDPAVQTVEVNSSVLVGSGHAYYITNTKVLADIQQLLETGEGSKERQKDGRCHNKDCMSLLLKLE